MSGSPIIQDGKLIDAVTHVLVNDPTTGYGIFIENMLDAAAWWDDVGIVPYEIIWLIIVGADAHIRPKKKGEIDMDFYKVPIGFGMALAMNQPAMNAYAAMTEEQKQAIINKAHNARSEKEMHDLVNSLAHPTMQ